MCRPDDFPPYDDPDVAEQVAMGWTVGEAEDRLSHFSGEHDDEAVPGCPECDALMADSAVLEWARSIIGKTLGQAGLITTVDGTEVTVDSILQPSGMFRELTPAEVDDFRAWARANWQPGQDINPLWHPVVRDECERMQQERRHIP